MLIRLLPSTATNRVVNLAINGVRRDLVVGQIVNVTDEELRIIRDAGFSYTYGDDILTPGEGPITDLIQRVGALEDQQAGIRPVEQGGTGVATLTGLVKGDGDSPFEAAIPGTDYVEPGPLVSSGLTMDTARLLGRSTADEGGVEEISIGSGLTLSDGTLAANPEGGFPDAGIPVSTGSGWDESISAPEGALVGTTDEQTLENKTLASPILTGTPEAPTADPDTDTDQIATTAFVKAALAELGTGVTLDGAETLTNKTINAADNTLVGVATTSFAIAVAVAL